MTAGVFMGLRFWMYISMYFSCRLSWRYFTISSM